METREKQLVKLIIELGSFFSNCDGDYDYREAMFIDEYLAKLSTAQHIPKNELEEIKKSMNTALDIDYLIQETARMRDSVIEEEKIPLLKTLSYFINGVIAADGFIHPNETKFYTEWKNAFKMDDDINIDEYLK